MNASHMRRALLSIICCMLPSWLYGDISNYTSYDPYPVYSTKTPMMFLSRAERNAIGKGDPCANHDFNPDKLSFAFSFFKESAKKGTDYWGNKEQPLGNLQGPWNILGLFYGEKTINTDPTQHNTYDYTVRNNLINKLGITDTEKEECLSETDETKDIATPPNTDDLKAFGFESVEIEYKKHGIRFDLQFDLPGNFGLIARGGVVDIRQRPKFNDLTCSATGLICPITGETPASCEIDPLTCNCKKLVINKITGQLCKVAQNVGARSYPTPAIGTNGTAEFLGYNIDQFHKTGCEDLYAGLWWRRLFDINFERDPSDWAHVIFTPFLVAEIAKKPGCDLCPRTLFAVPFGNNGHLAWGITGGFTIDWIETVMIGFDFGMTKYNSKRYNDFPVPTHCLQQGMYPYVADLEIEPGTNWEFGAMLNCYQFLDRLSAFFEYKIVDHAENKYTLCNLDNSTTVPLKESIQIKKMEDESKWQAHLVNVGFNYDVGDHLRLGFLWQAPVKQKNAYRTTTVMGSVILSF